MRPANKGSLEKSMPGTTCVVQSNLLGLGKEVVQGCGSATDPGI
jgi:hypothetical protein